MTIEQTPYRILVVDPSHETQDRIAQQLQGRGYSVRAVSDPASAVATLNEECPDVVLTDLFLPERAGLALMQELFARREYCPVIVMAQEASEQTIIESLRAGAVDYLHKPVDEAELAQVLQRAKDVVPGDLVDLPGLYGAECRLSVDSDPAHIPGVISWLIKTTAATFSPIRQIQLRGALQELLFNAVEHGNLEISGQEKHQALMEGRYEQLVAERQRETRLRDRRVVIHIVYDRAADHVVYRITDEGNGFDWRALLDRSQDVRESEAANGRGIFMSHAFFPSLTYNERGNEATMTVPLR